MWLTGHSAITPDGKDTDGFILTQHRLKLVSGVGCCEACSGHLGSKGRETAEVGVAVVVARSCHVEKLVCRWCQWSQSRWVAVSTGVWGSNPATPPGPTRGFGVRHLSPSNPSEA